ncbi:MAG: hypothetical protein BGP23_12595 [Lysobacterales bacterium 66-474]|nr:MAG: hypothetical protein ABT18_04455 [Rhodanobacter sp. SCN 66-43]OJY86982.1 MAG: hypothetical protein BGP23_12595 [Xanthomonadales bacterium 66-474]
MLHLHNSEDAHALQRPNARTTVNPPAHLRKHRLHDPRHQADSTRTVGAQGHHDKSNRASIHHDPGA